MAAGIGAIVCDFVKGQLGTPSAQVEVWRTEGYDGHAALRTGKGGGEYTLTFVRYDEVDDVFAWIDSIRKLAGTYTDVETDQASTDTNVLVKEFPENAVRMEACWITTAVASGHSVPFTGVRGECQVVFQPSIPP